MKMKKIIVLAIAGVFLIGFFAVAKPVVAASLGEIQNQLQSLLNQVNRLQLEIDNRQKANAEVTLPAFNIAVRWGNVIGKATTEGKKAASFNGSVEVQGNGNINVSSVSFESSDNDRIVSRTSAKVYWKSTTRDSWDGVRVRINNALPTDTVIIGTTQGTTTKTVQEFYDLTAPFIQDVGEGREIVIDGTPKSQSSSSSSSLSPASSSSGTSQSSQSSSSLQGSSSSAGSSLSSSSLSSLSSSLSSSSSSSQRKEVNIKFSRTCNSVSFVINNEQGNRADMLTFKRDGRGRIIKITGAIVYDNTGNSYDVDIDMIWWSFCISKVDGKAYLISSASSSSGTSQSSQSSSSLQGSSSSAGSSSSSTSSADGSSSSSSSSSSISSSSSSSSRHISRLRFDMTVRWGNVIGKATTEGKKAASFNGSVEVLGAATPGERIKLIGTKKFERGRSNNDRIISRTANKIVWKSTTYGSWDGVRVRISTSPDDTVVIGTAQGTTTMTARELYDLTTPSIQSAGDGREIVIEGTPNMKLLNFNMAVRWGNVIGKATAEGKTQTDFSGSIEIPDITISGIKKTEVLLIGGLRFEKGSPQHDKVSEDTNKIVWKSTTYGGWDGVKIRMRNVFPTDEVVIGTAQGTTTMTTQELYDLTAPFIQDVGKGREIVINGTPKTISDRFLSSSSSSSSSLPASSSSASSLGSSSSASSSSVSSLSSSSSSSSSISSASSSVVSSSSSTSSAQ